MHQLTWMSWVLKDISTGTRHLCADNWIESWGSTASRTQRLIQFTLTYLATAWFSFPYMRISCCLGGCGPPKTSTWGWQTAPWPTRDHGLLEAKLLKQHYVQVPNQACRSLVPGRWAGPSSHISWDVSAGVPLPMMGSSARELSVPYI